MTFSDFIQKVRHILAQLECPTGHAVLPLPVTEALRVPSAEEIADAQVFGRRIEKTARTPTFGELMSNRFAKGGNLVDYIFFEKRGELELPPLLKWLRP